MGESNSALPNKIDEKESLLDKIRKAFNRTTRYVDSQGKIGYISYPPKKGFSDKQKNEIRELEINGVEILGTEKDLSLRDLKKLKVLTLGQGTKAISSNVIPRSVETLIIPEGLTQIPEGAIYDSSIKSLIAPNFGIATTSPRHTNIFFDEFGRLNFTQDEYYSKGQVDYFNTRKNHSPKNPHVLSASQEASAARNHITRQLLEATSHTNNSQSLYVFRKTLDSESDFSIQAVMDTFPMPEDRSLGFDDKLLIGILVNGKDELDLRSLEKYENLKNVFVGKDVKRVVGFEDEPEKINAFDKNTPTKYKRQSPSGKDQVVVMLSSETVAMKDAKAATLDKTQTRVVEKDNEKDIDF